jgi:hypothetical protein
MNIARVFPRRTKASPDDALAFFGPPPPLAYALGIDAVHVSVTFTYDLPKAERLATDWSGVAPVTVGGPATGQRGEEFIPGQYVKQGYVITSRGCPNKCWFCNVWRRDGQIVRELPIVDGWNVLDDNLLACSELHIRNVFGMLHRQKKLSFRPQFTGGLEAKRLTEWHVEELANLKPKQMFFAYDTPDDYEPLREAGRMLLEAGFTRTSHALRCYVLIGWPKDTFAAAEARLMQTLEAGFTPMAMLYRDKEDRRNDQWREFQRTWARPAMIHTARH